MDSTQVQPLRLGTRLEGFEVSRVTDHDPGGYTYVGHEVASKKPVVIREYPPGVAQDLAALAKARHANLAVVLRSLEANGRAYLITEPIAGEALSDLLLRENTAFDEARLKSILLPLADGLEAAHVAGVLHLDIQPDHIVIRPNGAPVLVGFGAGNSPTRNPGYSAIEQYSADFRVGRWTDIFALGAVAYRLISGQSPPAADLRHAKDEMKPAREVGANKYHRSLLQAIDWALKVHPLERPQNLAQWKDALLGLREVADAGAGAGATVPITATMIRKFSELRQKKKEPEPPRPRKAEPTPIPPEAPGLVERELEKQRLEKEQAEREQLVRAEKERLEREREKQERDRREREQLERERQAREKQEQERLERERLERERAQRERAERERLELEALERARAEKVRAERERQEAERTERAERERQERERQDREREELERAERERQEREEQERERREREERERADRERAAREREARERAEQERADRERAERRERAVQAERERLDRERAAARRTEEDTGVPVVTVPPRVPQRPRAQSAPSSGGPSWISAIGALLVLVLTIGYWWYNDARRQHPERVAAEPLERVAPATPPAPAGASETSGPRPAELRPKESPAEGPSTPRPAAEEQREPPPEPAAEVARTAPAPEPAAPAESRPAPEAPPPAEPKAAEPKAPEPKPAPKTAKTPQAPAGASAQKQLVSQLKRKLAGNWMQENTYSVVVPGDGCYAKIARSWNIRFGGTADEGRALTATFQTKVRAQSAERPECRQFDDQIVVDGALTARPVSGNTLQVESVPTRCSGDCDQIAEVFNYRKLERRLRLNLSADGYLSFSEDEVDFELKGPRR